jgi:cephalosporin-C deacetylase-like acetyl esterase
VNRHLELVARGIFIEQSVARYFTFDATRAVDFLVSRPDVDPDRIGVTGRSGGGAITTYVSVFDPASRRPRREVSSIRSVLCSPVPRPIQR